MSNYKGYTPAQSKAHNNYIAKFARLEVRTTVEQREAIQAHAATQGESVNGFINGHTGGYRARQRHQRKRKGPHRRKRRSRGVKPWLPLL